MVAASRGAREHACSREASGSEGRRLELVTFLFDDDVPDDLSHLLTHVGHRVTFLREALPRDTSDAVVRDYAVQRGFVLVTCNRDDFVKSDRSDLATAPSS